MSVKINTQTSVEHSHLRLDEPLTQKAGQISEKLLKRLITDIAKALEVLLRDAAAQNNQNARNEQAAESAPTGRNSSAKANAPEGPQSADGESNDPLKVLMALLDLLEEVIKMLRQTDLRNQNALGTDKAGDTKGASGNSLNAVFTMLGDLLQALGQQIQSQNGAGASANEADMTSNAANPSNGLGDSQALVSDLLTLLKDLLKVLQQQDSGQQNGLDNGINSPSIPAASDNNGADDAQTLDEVQKTLDNVLKLLNGNNPENSNRGAQPDATNTSGNVPAADSSEKADAFEDVSDQTLKDSAAKDTEKLLSDIEASLKVAKKQMENQKDQHAPLEASVPTSDV